MLQVGMTYTVEQTVTTDMTARAIGSGGLEVFGTPFMMAMMESAAMLCVQHQGDIQHFRFQLGILTVRSKHQQNVLSK